MEKFHRRPEPIWALCPSWPFVRNGWVLAWVELSQVAAVHLDAQSSGRTAVPWTTGVIVGNPRGIVLRTSSTS